MLKVAYSLSSFLITVIMISCSAAISEVRSRPNENSEERIYDLIERLRKNILPRIPRSSYVYQFSKEDFYLLKWLEANSYNVEHAEAKLMHHLKWREAEQMDTIENEDWGDFYHEFPIFADTVAKDGTPVGEAWFAEWEVRRAVVTGQTKKLNRWVSQLAEMQHRRLYQSHASGKNVTHAMVLWDLEGFNLVNHGCSACTSIYVNMCNVYETHYPGLWGAIIMVNMNQAFDTILTLMKPFLKPSTKDTMHAFYAKTKWMPYLDNLISREQRSVRFGGTITRGEGD